MSLLDEKELNEVVHDISMKFFGKPFRDKAIYNYRLRTTGGRYLPVKRTIELNPKYTAEFNDNEVIGIIKHELCHYHLHIEGKGFKHGDKDFKELLKATGSPRHCSPLPSAKNRFKYIYKCADCGHSYKRVRRVDLKKYRCGKCGGKLVLNASLNNG
ncbi:SprT family protein [Lentibacillus amyloliquefaciens]|uniref:Protein SprT-like n=1 Tax=Lentibacillus amyloliquefaciens TaxID=1472767 RepID=A0A0U4FF25_9BACI|nr:SprT family protein [Lentibacillus amyloliquefaciens]ALX49133.1 SprT family protein [Lentibacillus amyloliquefaciens]